jgi:hypothetical protein
VARTLHDALARESYAVTWKKKGVDGEICARRSPAPRHP